MAGCFVRNIIFALVVGLGIVGIAIPAHAGTTCKIVPSWCPPPPPGGKGTVPEPATLALLAAGACAAGIAARRRNKK